MSFLFIFVLLIRDYNSKLLMVHEKKYQINLKNHPYEPDIPNNTFDQ
jgi:hypothetical protein